MPYPRAAWERAMQVQEVILKALSGEIHWFRAAEILGMHPRSVRRWRERYEQFGYHGLIDKRYQRPSQRRVGIEHIPAYSPQARGRSERLNRTFQDRLVNELRVAGITSLEAANAYLAEVFLPRHNATFARPPRDPASAFVPLGAVDLDLILCHEESRVVARDNTVTLRQQGSRSPPRPVDAVAPAWRLRSASISMAATPIPAGRSTSGRSGPMAGPWTLPRLWTSG